VPFMGTAQVDSRRKKRYTLATHLSVIDSYRFIV